MPLLIIESPNKIKKLESILGPGFRVQATIGHFMKLSKTDMGFDENFEPKYTIDPKKKMVVSDIKREAKLQDIIYIATDPDREGEAIAKHIHDILPKRGKTIKRVKFNSITKSAVNKAIKDCGDIDLNLYNAQKARRITDRIVGYKVSPVMWKKGLNGTSAGRVQSVALNYVSSREKEVRAFMPEEFWNVNCSLKGFTVHLDKIDGKTFKLDKTMAKKIESDISGGTLKVLGVASKKRSVAPKAPFKTSTLQQEASNLFGWRSKKTMDVAQSIFGMGLITYHRSDSERSEPSKVSGIRSKVSSLYGKSYLKMPQPVYGGNAAQDAHEAIRPTFEAVQSPMGSNEKRLLGLITNRFKASQMSNAEYDLMKVILEVTGGGVKYQFSAKGSAMLFDGFLKVYGSKKGDELLPSMKKGDTFSIKSANPTQHFTKSSPRYTDATLIKKLEKEGVGRPSTYASIIQTLEDRKYVKRAGKALEATDVGIIIQEFLSGRLPDLVSSGFTSEMESSLDQISEGTLDYFTVMKRFDASLELALIEANESGLPDTMLSEHPCPKCSSKMIKKISKHGPFLACTTWPKCNGALKVDGSSNVKIKLQTGKPCPKCSNILVIRKGKNGEFWGCNAFPTCKHAEPKITANTKMCDKCSSPMTLRSGKYGRFYGCSGYPKCRNIIKFKK